MGLENIGHLCSGFLGAGLLFFIGGMTLCMAQGNIHYYEFVVTEGEQFYKAVQYEKHIDSKRKFPRASDSSSQRGYSLRKCSQSWILWCHHPLAWSKATKVTFTTEEGTLWWHAHSEWTRATVHGAIVVLPAAGTVYPFPKPDEEEVIVLGMSHNFFIHLVQEFYG
ncbi:Laccase-2 [Vitis vinifera]|uniref:Laccase-2 n=1 Tax=Vitis vinifera TaxID=29760 RepID=A0A438BLB9_VITVI|nr:Laccase-2 [Vitis vinifera]